MCVSGGEKKHLRENGTVAVPPPTKHTSLVNKSIKTTFAYIKTRNKMIKSKSQLSDTNGPQNNINPKTTNLSQKQQNKYT